MRKIILFAVVHVLLTLKCLHRVNCQSELVSCDFEMPMTCGFVVQTAAGGAQWSLNQGQSFEGRIYGPLMDHTKGTPDGYYATSIVVGTAPVIDTFPVRTEMMTPTILLPKSEGALVFYFYVWRNTRNDRLGTILNVYGCQGRKVWGTTVHVAMEGWQRLEIQMQCPEAFEIYFEGIHETIGSSISIDDVTMYSTPFIATGHPSPHPTNPGTGTNEASIQERKATKVSDDPLSTLIATTVAVRPTKSSREGKGSNSTIAIVLFLLAFLLLGMSVFVHVFFWRKRLTKKEHSEELTGVQIQNSAYDCLTLSPGGFRGSPEGDSMRSNASAKLEHKEKSCPNLHSVDIERNNTCAVERQKSEKRSGRLHRTRSKTMPSKGSQSSFKYYEIVENDTETGKNVIRRAPKLSVIGRSHAFSRSNSVPTRKHSSMNGYETVDCLVAPGGLYRITDLIDSPLHPEVFSLDTSECRSDSYYHTLRATTKYRRTSTANNSPSIPSGVSLKVKQDKTPLQKSSVYDTPPAKNLRRRTSSEHTKSPNYYTLEPDIHIPDVVAANKLNTMSSESSHDSVRLECYDQLNFKTSTPSDDYAAIEEN